MNLHECHDGVSKEKWEKDNPENLSLRIAESQKTKSHEKNELSIKKGISFFHFKTKGEIGIDGISHKTTNPRRKSSGKKRSSTGKRGHG